MIGEGGEEAKKRQETPEVRVRVKELETRWGKPGRL